MEITVKMPICISPRLIDLRVAEGDEIALGDILFSYESDGALLFEYSACTGIVKKVHTVTGGEIKSGGAVITVEGSEDQQFKF